VLRESDANAEPEEAAYDLKPASTNDEMFWTKDPYLPGVGPDRPSRGGGRNDAPRSGSDFCETFRGARTWRRMVA